MAEAEHIFQEVEEMQKKMQPEYQILYSIQGLRYYDLQLDKGKYMEVLSRANQMLEWGGGLLI